MVVSLRHTLAACALGALAFSMPAIAGGMGGMSGGGSPSTPSTGSGATGGGHCDRRCSGNPGTVVHTPRVRIPGPTVAVGIPEVGGANTVLFGGGMSGGRSTTIIAGNQGLVDTVVVGNSLDYGLGGGFFEQIGGLNVEGEFSQTITERVPHYSERLTLKQIAIRAVCLDDSATPHPASRPSSDVHVADGFEGELFRCMAGTSMQVTVGHVVDGKPVFDEASTRTCAKGEALRLNADGQIECRTQEAKRDCHERSLLRKWGPGIKILTARAAERHVTYSEVQREVTQHTTRTTGPIIFDGGVGAY